METIEIILKELTSKAMDAKNRSDRDIAVTLKYLDKGICLGLLEAIAVIRNHVNKDKNI